MVLPVAIQHVIGTVTIFMLTISVGVSFATVTAFVQTDINKKEMSQVAAHVSLNLVEIATLTNSSGYAPVTMVKTLDFPTDVGGRAYLIELVDATSQGQGYLVRVSLVAQRGTSVDSLLPINSTVTLGQTVVVTTRNQEWYSVSNDDIVPGSQPAVTYVSELDGKNESAVYGGDNAVVWARQDENNVLYMGIGHLK